MHYLQKIRKLQGAHNAVHFAAASHIFNQILQHNILHNKNTSQNECEKFYF